MIDINEITNGKCNGDLVWVCDFRFNEYSEAWKPIRHVRPTQVQITSNEQLPKNKDVYYSESHFLALGKSGKPLKGKVIAPFDNTGYHASTGTPLNVFTSESECKSHYKKQCEAVIKLLEKRQAVSNNFFNSEIKKIKDFM